jgi:kinesin family protein 2/24
VKPLIDCAFSGAKITCFAYGQTGSGKTYTMLGHPTHHIPGLYLLASHDIFKKLPLSHSIWVSFYEIYCGKLYDLLNDRALLFAREDARQNVNIVGLQEKRVATVEALMQTIEYGGSVRVTAQNSANADSSRSHAVLQVIIKGEAGGRGAAGGRISFIDLAGSERGADHAD